VSFPLAWAEEVCEAATAALRANRHRITDGRLDGAHWAASCYRAGADITRRRRSSRSRRAA
jgi:hypothetical protein